MSQKPILRSASIRLSMLLSSLLLLAVSGAAQQQKPDFSGLWKQDNDRCQPRRGGDVTLHIEHREPEIMIETTIARGAAPLRRAMQKYTTDGKVSISTGTDGDEFHSATVWSDSSLAFTIEEHEDGRILHFKETWTLIENGAALERKRERPDGEKQILIYRRER